MIFQMHHNAARYTITYMSLHENSQQPITSLETHMLIEEVTAHLDQYINTILKSDDVPVPNGERMYNYEGMLDEALRPHGRAIVTTYDGNHFTGVWIHGVLDGQVEHRSLYNPTCYQHWENGKCVEEEGDPKST